MTDRPSHNLDGLDINLARRIDEVCRRFEGRPEARASNQRVEGSLVEIPRG